MAVVFIPAVLRPLVGQPRVEVPGATIGEILDRLEALYPGVITSVEDGDTRRARGHHRRVGRWASSISARPEVHFLPRPSGGLTHWRGFAWARAIVSRFFPWAARTVGKWY
jgi:molybdopterin converting factor small subunit